MKKFLVIVLSFIIMLVSFSCTNNDKSAVNNHKNQQPQLEQESSNVSEDVIILNMAGRDVKAKLYDNKAALSLKSMLPYTVTVSRAADALCGSVSENLNVNHEEDLSTWEIGEIGWFDGWFTVLCDNEENMRKRTRTIIGKIVDEDIAYMQSLTGTINISIKLEETNTSAQENSNTEENQNQEEETNSNQTPEQTPVINQEEITAMFIYVNGNKLKVTLEKNSAVESLVDELKKGDITYTADDYGNFEKVGDLPCSLPRDDRQMSVNYGDVVYYAGRSLCLYYGSNSWSFTPIGKINGYSQSELRTLICAGSGVITVKISLN